MSRLHCIIATGLLAGCCFTSQAQEGGPLRIDKIDPPNWYAALPKPLLLVRGEGLSGATFALSDAALHVERTVVSKNGHWAQLWLSASPAAAETVQLRVERGALHVEQPYTFAARRDAASGMAGFTPGDVIYLIMTDRFADGDASNDGPEGHSTAASAVAVAERAKPRGWHGGDLRGITAHLDYLQSLGVSTVWTTPVYQNHEPEAYHGYHATDYYAVDEHYGTMEDLQSLVGALHARGMKLLLDTVPNHVGPAHVWVTDPPSDTWLHGSAAHHLIGESKFHALIDPHAPERDRVPTLQGWFVDQLPDMNTEDPAVAQYLRQNTVWWVEQSGADGLRIDTFPYVDREFWNGFHRELQGLYPRFAEVGEVSAVEPEVTSAFAGGVTRSGVDTGLYTPFDFPFYFTALDVFADGASFAQLKQMMEADALYPHPERLVTFLNNHDNKRIATAVPSAALRRLAFTLLLTTRGTPQLYSGDEIAMRGGDDPDNRRDFPGGFPGSATNAFTAAGRGVAARDSFDAIAGLIRLRKDHAVLACGMQQNLLATQDAMAYVRYGSVGCGSDAVADGERALVVLHRGVKAVVHVELRQTAAEGCEVQSVVPENAHVTRRGTALDVEMAIGSAIVFCRKQPGQR